MLIECIIIVVATNEYNDTAGVTESNLQYSSCHVIILVSVLTYTSIHIELDTSIMRSVGMTHNHCYVIKCIVLVHIAGYKCNESATPFISSCITSCKDTSHL